MMTHDKLCTYPDKYAAPSAVCDCNTIGRVREQLGDRLAELEAMAQTRWRNEAHVYWEGARDAYDAAERIARGQ